MYQAQIAYRISDFRPFIKPCPDHTVWQTDGQKPFFKFTRLITGPDQHSYLVKPVIVIHQPFNGR